MIPKGNYDGRIKAAWCEADNNGDLRMCFCLMIATDGGTVEVEARHGTTGEYGWIGKKVAEVCDIPWPDGLKNIESCVGRDVPVQVKHKEYKGQMYANAYISVGNVPASPQQVDMAVAKLSTQEGDGVDVFAPQNES